MGFIGKSGTLLRQTAIVAGSFSAGVALLAMAMSMEVQIAKARPGIEQTGANRTAVNRALKGDRLPLVPDANNLPAPLHVKEPKLPEGCIASATLARNAFWMEVPGRCVAMLATHEIG
jgi:hypothetical protein